MSLINRNTRLYRISLWAAVVICLLLLFTLLDKLDASNVPFDDYPEYWAAGRLLLQGSNPYSIENVVRLRNEVGQVAEKTEYAAIFLYPPWALPIMLPFGLLPYKISRILWLLLNIAVLIASVDRIWRLYGGQSHQRWLAWLLVITFFPTIIVLAAGHANPLFLLSLSLFILLADRDKPTPKTDMLAGVCIALLTIKFHLHYLFLIAALLWILKNKRWSIMAGAGASILSLTLLAVAFYPQVLVQYLHLLKTYPFYAWATPTPGSVLRYLFGLDQFWLQFLPPVFGAAWLLMFHARGWSEWRWADRLPLLLLVSVCTAAYGWTGDDVILLIPILMCLISLLGNPEKGVIKAFMASLLLINLLAFFFHSRPVNLSDFWLFWFSPVLLFWFFMAQKYFRKSKLALRLA